MTTGQFPSTQTYTPGSGTTPATLTSSNPLNVLFYNFDVNFGLTLQDLQNKNIAQILAEPTITTLSGQKASFLAVASPLPGGAGFLGRTHLHHDSISPVRGEAGIYAAGQ